MAQQDTHTGDFESAGNALPAAQRPSSQSGGIRKALNSIAHKRAREVARKKRIAKPKTGVAIKSEFRSTATRIVP